MVPLSTRTTRFSTQKLENATLFLGYMKKFRSSKMFFDLAGCRQKTDIHNLQHTRTQLVKCLSFISNINDKHGSIWFVNPKSPWLPKVLFGSFSYFQKESIFDSITLWCTRWTPGFFTNKKSAYRHATKRLHFPSILFYTSRTSNTQRLADGRNASILQVGASDSNGSLKDYTYGIAANEKTAASTVFFLKLIVNYTLISVIRRKSDFFRKNV